MASVRIRPIQQSEIAEAVTLYFATLSDMQRRNGQTPVLRDQTETEAAYAHIAKTGIFYAAEVDGVIRAICHGSVRDRLWFLSGFWVDPLLQRQGIGGQLLRQVYRDGQEAGADTFFVWASIDRTAMASYMKLGMLPGCQLLKFSGTPAGLPALPEGYRLRQFDLGFAQDLDRTVRGSARTVDHQFLSTRPARPSWQVEYAGAPVGYFYLNGTPGGIGPVAWTDPAHADATLTLACREAGKGSEQVSLAAVGVNHSAIRFALAAGLQLTGFSNFLTSAPFGQLDRYIPSGPLLF